MESEEENQELREEEEEKQWSRLVHSKVLNSD